MNVLFFRLSISRDLIVYIIAELVAQVKLLLTNGKEFKTSYVDPAAYQGCSLFCDACLVLIRRFVYNKEYLGASMAMVHTSDNNWLFSMSLFV
jgi:hypothetical protein